MKVNFLEGEARAEMLFIADSSAPFFLLFVDLFPLRCRDFSNFISECIYGKTNGIFNTTY